MQVEEWGKAFHMYFCLSKRFLTSELEFHWVTSPMYVSFLKADIILCQEWERCKGHCILHICQESKEKDLISNNFWILKFFKLSCFHHFFFCSMMPWRESENFIICLVSCSETQRQHLVWSQSLKSLGPTCITHSLSEPMIQKITSKHYTERSLVIIDTSETTNFQRTFLVTSVPSHISNIQSG